jgi:hypothetical protein
VSSGGATPAISINAATTTTAGSLSAADKVKIDALPATIVSSVNTSGGTTGLTFSGGPVTSSGTMTMAGTLGIASGGTGQITAAAAINALLPGQGGNAGEFLTTDGTNVSWAAGGGPVTTPGAVGTFALGSSKWETISGAPLAIGNYAGMRTGSWGYRPGQGIPVTGFTANNSTGPSQGSVYGGTWHYPGPTNTNGTNLPEVTFYYTVALRIA